MSLLEATTATQMGDLRPRHALPSAGIVADALRLARLADAIVGGGGGSLQIIIDYDRTITSARNADGSATTTSYGAFGCATAPA